MASAGYPDSSSSGDVVTGVDDAEALDDVHVIHAGTATADGDLVTAGGRVLAVVATGGSVAEARDRAYDGVATHLVRRRPAPHRHRRRGSEPVRVHHGMSPNLRFPGRAGHGKRRLARIP